MVYWKALTLKRLWKIFGTANFSQSISYWIGAMQKKTIVNFVNQLDRPVESIDQVSSGAATLHPQFREDGAHGAIVTRCQ